MRLLTVGHGASSAEHLVDLLVAAGVEAVVDIRRFPGSRRNPHFGEHALAESLSDAGLRYRWDARLGGRRRLPPGGAERDAWWRVEAFRAYAAHARTPEHAAARADLVRQAATERTAIMCSEVLWWRCHRRLVADALVLVHGVDVAHLGHDGRVSGHVPAEGARISAEGLHYPG